MASKRKLSNLRRNVLRREKYRLAREAGLSPAEARALRGVSKKANEAVLELKKVENELDSLIKAQKAARTPQMKFEIQLDMENKKKELQRKAANLKIVVDSYVGTKPTLAKLKTTGITTFSKYSGIQLTKEVERFFSEAIRSYEGIKGLTPDQFTTEEEMQMYEEQQKAFESALNELESLIDNNNESAVRLRGEIITKDHIYRMYGFSELWHEDESRQWLTTAITGYRRGELVL